ncbi:MAG: UvrD-helicase domain-containing protein [Clostridia bacterium]|nr:UvrD-helicase domain-containing protein [Clostridia bacterium]
MAEGRKWTRMQSLAMDTRDKTLLVSAAAGSGKTATLTERIIRSILDEENPVSIENMLVVTFTRLAATELRERISGAIKARLAADPGNARLERQMYMLPSARINTIDSFCIYILRENAERVGIESGFRIPDEAEAVMLGESILEGLFNEIADGALPDVATPDQMDMLTDCLTNTGKQDSLAEVINHLYLSTVNSEGGVEELRPLVEEYSPGSFTSVESTGFGKYIMSRLDGMAEHYIRIFEEALAMLSDASGKSADGVRLQMQECIGFLRELREAGTYRLRRALLLSVTFDKAATACDAYPYSTVLRNELKEEVAYFRDKLFFFPEEDWRVAYDGLYEQVSTLYRVIKEYDRLLMEEKFRRGILEFSDILRLTHRCLWDGDRLTDVAIAEREKYDAVYVDEYQDVNGLQNRIFDAISKPTNRFMVGDIKQSIYAFRSARADIFAGLKREYPPIDEAENSDNGAVFMSDNFRCDRGIIDFVNTVFDRIFPLIGDSIGYVPEDRLGFAKVREGEEEPPYSRPEICLVDTASLAAEAKAEGRDGYDKSEASPILVAHKIRELLASGKKNDGSPIREGDIAIIMRKAKGRAERYKRALEKLGIPAAVAEENRFFLNPECRLALCLLNSIDNPRRDIYLAGLMMSPLCGFSADEMLLIGREGGASLYDSLLSYFEKNPDYTRGGEFIRRLEHYRLISEGMAVDELVMRLWNETGLLALGAASGGRERLLQLYDHARSFENGTGGGLYGFISYINGISERKNSLDKREAPSEGNAVSIITAHGSKGLEFPVVFLVGAEESFGFRPAGEAPRYEYEEGFGIGMVLRTPGGLSPVRNATREVVIDYRRRRDIEEEARILYVILTRAREQLYVIGSVGSDFSKYMKKREFYRLSLDEYSVYRAESYIDMLLGSHPFAVRSVTEFLEDVPSELLTHSSGEKVDTPPEKAVQNSENVPDAARIDIGCDEKELATALRARLEFVYPRAALCRLPAKLSVSALYPEVLDEADADITDVERYRRDKAELRLPGKGIRPEFISGKERDGASKRGVATHMFFQFCDFERLAALGAEAELQRLADEKFLSERDCERVILSEVELFRSSELLARMRGARSILREFRFNVKLPAEMFTSDPELASAFEGEELLVQGVIDCLYEDAHGSYHLVDYKTDRMTERERQSDALAAARLRRDHATQLSYYAEAVKRILGRSPDTVEVYSTQLGRTYEI